MNRTKMLLGCKYSRVEEDEAGYIRVYDLTTPEEIVSYLYENGICVTEIKTDKIGLVLVFVSIFTLISVAAKQKAWLSICGSLGGGMLLFMMVFMMVSMITPLGSTIINVLLCAVGGTLFAFGFGAISNVILKKTSLV